MTGFPNAIVRTTLLAALLAASVAGVGGCRRASEPQVTSAWPVADSERVVPKPPVPPKWPLTGLNAPSASATRKRAMSVKVENSTRSRPQTGLNSADLVYETVTEGGITRFNVIFHSKQPREVGPVRSARLSDLWIVPQYNALFFYSGATRPINSKVNSAGIANLSEDAGVSAPYFRSARRSSPHNLYLRPAAGRREAKRRGYPLNGKPKTLRFGRSIESSDVVREITVPLSDVQTSKWVYKGSTKRYSRFNGSTPHRDAVTGAPVTARNVVVLWATYRPVSRDKFGSTTYDITLGGEGRATLFRDGRKIDGTWEADRGQPPTIRAEDRRIVRLAPGNTWFEVVHTNVNIRMK